MNTDLFWSTKFSAFVAGMEKLRKFFEFCPTWRPLHERKWKICLPAFSFHVYSPLGACKENVIQKVWRIWWLRSKSITGWVWDKNEGQWRRTNKRLPRLILFVYQCLTFRQADSKSVKLVKCPYIRLPREPVYDGLICIIIEVYLFLAALGLHCHTWAFYCYRKERLFSSCGAQASHCGGSLVVEHGYGVWVSAFVVHWFSCPTACGIFSRLWIKPMSPALAGGFLTTGPRGKSNHWDLILCLW